jgi:hypothetical protein
MQSDLWLDLASAGSNAFVSLSTVWQFRVMNAGGGVYYVAADLTNGSSVTVASNFSSDADARAWVLDTIKHSNVK